MSELERMGALVTMVAGIVGLGVIIWRASANYTTLKNLQASMVTKLAMTEFEKELIKMVTNRFVTKDELRWRIRILKTEVDDDEEKRR